MNKEKLKQEIIIESETERQIKNTLTIDDVKKIVEWAVPYTERNGKPIHWIKGSREHI